jgi:tRNA A37 methylthiotransferase MiaB
MKEQIDKHSIHERSKKLIKLGKKKTELYRKKLLQNTIVLEGIVEHKESGLFTALSDHYVRVYFSDSKEVEKMCLQFKPLAAFQEGLKVERID